MRGSSLSSGLLEEEGGGGGTSDSNNNYIIGPYDHARIYIRVIPSSSRVYGSGLSQV